MTKHNIKIGDTVRSYDFEFGRDINPCYVEGEVMRMGKFELFHFDCDRYSIRVTKRVFDGEECELREDYVYPPVNGTETLFGNKTNGVEVI